MNQPTRVMLSVMVLLCLVSTLVPAKAADKDKLVGSWRMVAFKVQASDTGETKDALGPKPQGRMILTASGFITNCARRQ